MLRALPKSQQARWLEIGRVFDRVRRPARPGEHVAFTPVAEAGAARAIPTRFSARTARIPSGLRPNFADATASPSEANEAPAPPVAPEAAPAVEERPTAAPPVAVTSEFAARAEPEAASPPVEPAITPVTEMVPLTTETVSAASAPEEAGFLSEGLGRRRRFESDAEWGGWTTYAAKKDIVSDDETVTGGYVAAMPDATPPPATSPSVSPTTAADAAPPPPAPAPERRAEEAEPRVSAIEYFRAAPW